MMKSMLPDVVRLDGAVVSVEREIQHNITALVDTEKHANVCHIHSFTPPSQQSMQIIFIHVTDQLRWQELCASMQAVLKDAEARAAGKKKGKLDKKGKSADRGLDDGACLCRSHIHSHPTEFECGV